MAVVEDVEDAGDVGDVDDAEGVAAGAMLCFAGGWSAQTEIPIAATATTRIIGHFACLASAA